MTADCYPYDMSFLARTATRISNEVKGVAGSMVPGLPVIRTWAKP